LRADELAVLGESPCAAQQNFFFGDPHPRRKIRPAGKLDYLGRVRVGVDDDFRNPSRAATLPPDLEQRQRAKRQERLGSAISERTQPCPVSRRQNERLHRHYDALPLPRAAFPTWAIRAGASA